MTRRNFLRTLGIGAVSLPAVGLGAAEYRSADFVRDMREYSDGNYVFTIGHIIRSKTGVDWVITDIDYSNWDYLVKQIDGLHLGMVGRFNGDYLQRNFKIVGCACEEKTIAPK